MPLHLLGKKSWNVYNAANIARVKADEEAAAAREHAADQRMQELDAERRAAILRGRTPPPEPEEDSLEGGRSRRDRHGHDKKRRKLRGEDDTDMDIRLAASVTKPKDGDEESARVLRLRKPASDAPLTDHAGHIDLFPVDIKEAIKREKNTEAEKEKRNKEQAFEDQYTMRFSNAAGKNGLDQPWYTAQQRTTRAAEDSAVLYPELENKNVWGNEDPRRKEREQARISSNDPFAFMQKAQTQLKKSKEDKKKWRGRTGGAGITRAVVTAVEVEAEAEVPSESAGTNTLIAEIDHAVAVEIVSGIESLGDNTSRRDTTEA
ncbi:hypothetical protein N0V91_003249 [Didymella pomorum]|uniref:CBF1-interacting co-repressor CIR N-terminal domain-containing protein n=1 Tax=Didymella pomorum TaxID=749634 RepID=A0A9W8ZLF6_9PLEO|nr:hypothetical protein N0V91_003249 [Didymella pomorum]